MRKTLIFIICIVLVAINLQAQETEYANGWDRYQIAKRTDANPLVNKSFLKGNLTERQKELALATPYVDSSLKVYDVAHFDNNTIEFEILHDDMSFYMPWNIELSNDNLTINSGEVQIDLVRYLD